MSEANQDTASEANDEPLFRVLCDEWATESMSLADAQRTRLEILADASIFRCRCDGHTIVPVDSVEYGTQGEDTYDYGDEI